MSFSPGRGFIITCNEARLARKDPVPNILFIFLPLLGMVLMKGVFQPALATEDLRDPSGAEQAVPGLAIAFGFLFISAVIHNFFREHAWGTWDRLRASQATLAELVFGKMTFAFALGLFQFLCTFVIGGFLTGLEVKGSWIAISAIAIAFDLFVVSVGLAVAVWSRTLMQANMLSYILVLMMSFISGALVPLSTLPDWAKSISPAIPIYWVMQSLRDAIAGTTDGSLAITIAILLTSAIVISLVSLPRLRFDEKRVGLA